jgi:predicted 2-oxoglutarate/Fe(II)-dependent dioxygenase YbiX
MKTTLQDYVAIYKLNDLGVLKQIINEIDKGNWGKHSYNDPVTNKNTSYDDDLEISYQQDAITKYLDGEIKKFVADYTFTLAPMPFELQELSEIRFNRYAVGTNMKPHHDHIHTLFDGERKGVPILSVLGLLNDDFEGGDFLMFDGKKVNLEAGDVIIFPSNFLYPHAVTTVTKGTRYSFVTWGW